MQYAVVKTGGKQYLVKSGDSLTVDHIDTEVKGTVQLPVLAMFDTEKGSVELGSPLLKKEVTATVLEQGKGEKVRVARFKSKVRYRKVRGFRPTLTKLSITL